ncbi:MAG: Gfo/Idh/MocA family oxidoreductase [Oscillospiraceae bacterium]|nr:Gfo/Idh/MocA family oxidoreductase [Oscillospiraceae bacterium]
MLKIGVVGVGNMGTFHTKTLYSGEVEGAALAAVCDINPARIAFCESAFPGAERFEHYADMLSSGLLNAVIIAVPHYFHCPLSYAAFEAGLHVLCEKPAGVYAGEVREMNRRAKASGKVFSLMLNQRTEPIYIKCRELVQSGALGTIQRLTWDITNWYRTLDYYRSAEWRGTWAGEGGGVLLNQAVHNLDLWQWILGMPEAVTAFCGFGKHHAIEVEDEAIIFARYKNGCTAQFTASTGEPFGVNRLEIIGEAGRLTAENGRLFLKRDADLPAQDITPGAAGGGHKQILQNFANAALYGEPLIAPGEDGIFSVELINAAYLSAWESRAVEIPVPSEYYRQKLAQKAAFGFKKPEAAPEVKSDPEARWRVRW